MGGSRFDGPVLCRQPSPPFVHFWRCPSLHDQGIASLFQFIEKIAVFLGAGGIADGNAAVVIGGTVLADMLKGRAKLAVGIGGKFGEEGEWLFPSSPVFAEDHSYLVHAEMNRRIPDEAGKSRSLGLRIWVNEWRPRVGERIKGSGQVGGTYGRLLCSTKKTRLQMLLNVNATGMNVVPFPEGVLEADKPERLNIDIYLPGSPYSNTQLDDSLKKLTEVRGFEWLRKSGSLWAVDATILRDRHDALKGLGWFRGIAVTSFTTQFGTVHGAMGHHDPRGGGLAAVAHHDLTVVTFALDQEVVADSNAVFYSWMSDRPGYSNRGFIQDCLEKAVKTIARDPTLNIVPSLDRDTQGESGAAEIVATILRKIERARVFVADVTLVNTLPSRCGGLAAFLFGTPKRLTSNPNVLVELGYAAGKLGWERCLLVVNTAFGGPEELPFDLRGRIVLRYHVANKRDRKAVRETFIPILRAGIAEALQL